MRKKPEDEQDAAKLAWLIQPAKDLVENFSIDIQKALNSYLDAVRQDAQEGDPEKYKFFDFQEACRVVVSSMSCGQRKVELVYELTHSVVDLAENRTNEDGNRPGRKGGRRRAVNFGSTNYELQDLKSIKAEALAHYEKEEKDQKKAIDSLRLVENAELAEVLYERKICLVEKPTQFLFKLNYGQLNRMDEQVLNSKSRPDVIGKVKDFAIKKSDINHEQQMVYSHDCYKKNLDEFTLPGARWIPDNNELAANFGVADIEAELDLEQEAERISAYGPFKDPLSGREVVAPPRWFVEKEAVRQQQEIQSRASMRASSVRTLRDSQGFGSQPTRLSQPFIEKNRNTLHNFVSFVEGRLNKNRPSTHLNTGLVDMMMDNFGGAQSYADKENEIGLLEDMDYDGGNDDYDDDNGPDDYVRDLSRRKERRAPAPWDDFEQATHSHWYNGDEDLPVSIKPVKVIIKEPPTPMETMRRKYKREEKIVKTRRDEFMATHDYLQDYYYWRSSARINPNKDWKVEALRAAILKEKKRRAKEKTAKIREARERTAPRRRTTRNASLVDFAAALEDNLEPMGNRRTLGAECKYFGKILTATFLSKISRLSIMDS
uniref:CNDH2_N domain-containing protein n=1 Tax=Caenorhabditis japonica TaxID=281687 RepID=A0A8R1DJV6_CAEJA